MSRYIDIEPIIKKAHEEGFVLVNVDLLETVDEADVVERKWYDEHLKNERVLSAAIRKYGQKDYVEVVRCQECIWYLNFEGMDRCVHDYCGMKAYPHTYCSYGQRREDRAEEKGETNGRRNDDVHCERRWEAGGV